jgi:hypothetical protein
MRIARRKQRGASSVEAAISMLVIIPAFMYALFLDDLLRYAADLQETVVSTPWDFTGQNYMQPKIRGLKGHEPKAEPYGGQTSVQHVARLMFCDHESSGDSYTGTSSYTVDCDSENHHKGKALSGHVCWLNKDAHQLTCETVQTDLGEFNEPLFKGYKGKFGENGGLYECHAKEVVENYLLPKTFLQEFAGETQLTKKNWSQSSSGIHKDAQKGDSSTAYYLQEQRFAVLMDPWALNETTTDKDKDERDVDLAVKPGTKKGDLYDRVEHVYKNNLLYYPYLGGVMSFMADASQKLLMPGVMFVMDNPLSPNVSLTKRGAASPGEKIKQEGKEYTYFSTPWKDGSGDPYKATHDKRGKYYMGCDKQGEDC